ncbi:unnamed protein product [Schistocephalus solidus]|uniref:Uncharacterized protein n=1 Tax=Schistocephalus solidus TaxID=70667 RepID=A0A183SYI6_SCHSO|nr:unnamed protein product [Schistocephalus solidus]
MSTSKPLKGIAALETIQHTMTRGCQLTNCTVIREGGRVGEVVDPRLANWLSVAAGHSSYHVTLCRVNGDGGCKLSVGLQASLHVQQWRVCLVGEPSAGCKFICQWRLDAIDTMYTMEPPPGTAALAGCSGTTGCTSGMASGLVTGSSSITSGGTPDGLSGPGIGAAGGSSGIGSPSLSASTSGSALLDCRGRIEDLLVLRTNKNAGKGERKLFPLLKHLPQSPPEADSELVRGVGAAADDLVYAYYIQTLAPQTQAPGFYTAVQGNFTFQVDSHRLPQLTKAIEELMLRRFPTLTTDVATTRASFPAEDNLPSTGIPSSCLAKSASTASYGMEISCPAPHKAVAAAATGSFSSSLSQGASAENGSPPLAMMMMMRDSHPHQTCSPLSSSFPREGSLMRSEANRYVNVASSNRSYTGISSQQGEGGQPREKRHQLSFLTSELKADRGILLTTTIRIL